MGSLGGDKGGGAMVVKGGCGVRRMSEGDVVGLVSSE